MTFIEKMEEQLVACGLSKKDANKILDARVKQEDSFTTRWNEDITAYPEVMQIVLWHGVKQDALSWCNTHCPEAWFKPMFMELEDQKKMGLPV